MLSTSTISLLELPTHQLAYIDAITANPHFAEADDSISRRLYDLGFLPDTPIKVIAKGLFGKPPFAVQLATGGQFSLRQDELAKIQCRLS